MPTLNERIQAVLDQLGLTPDEAATIYEELKAKYTGTELVDAFVQWGLTAAKAALGEKFPDASAVVKYLEGVAQEFADGRPGVDVDGSMKG
jgi:hypothetical protein